MPQQIKPITSTAFSLRYLLDTNILIQAVRGGAVWEQIKTLCDPLMMQPRPLVCIVTHGELRSFAEQREWGEFKREQALFLLGYFTSIGIDPVNVLETYAEIDTWSRRHSVRMGKNDLWIAAAAIAGNATLVTTDRDFDHLDGVFLSRLYVNPAL